VSRDPLGRGARRLGGDGRRVLEHSEVRPDVRLSDEAEELSLERPETHGQLAGGGQQHPAVQRHHFHARYAGPVSPVRRSRAHGHSYVILFLFYLSINDKGHKQPLTCR